MGIVQGLTEFLPISSSGHLLLVPSLLGWDDAFITSLAFSVMLHVGTLAALLAYFRADWVRIVPAGFATIRDRSFAVGSGPAARLAPGGRDDPGGDRRLRLQRHHRDGHPRTGARRRHPRRGWHHPVAGGPARPLGPAGRGCDVPDRDRDRRGPGAGPRSRASVAPASRSRPADSPAWIAKPRPASASSWRRRSRPARSSSRSGGSSRAKLGVDVDLLPLLVGMLSSFVAGIFAISILLRYLRTHSLTVFVVYRFVLAGVVLVVLATR